LEQWEQGVDDRQQAYEQTYAELLAIAARLDVLRRRGKRDLEPLANSAMYAASHAAWSLWWALRPMAVPPVFPDLNVKYLELAEEWGGAGREGGSVEGSASRTEIEAAKAARAARASGV
jgi:hypothetical protein